MVNSVESIFITETWFHNSVDSKRFFLSGQFEVLEKDITKKQSDKKSYMVIDQIC